MPKTLLLLGVLLLTPPVWAGQKFNPQTNRPDYCLTIEEEDGSPSITACQPLEVANGSLTDDGDGRFSYAGGVSGSGTTNTIPKFTDSTTLGNSLLTDDGTNVTLGSGKLILTSGTMTTSQPVIDATQTWNSGAVTFNALKLNVTDTASATASTLLDLQVGAASKFSVTKAGATTVGGSKLTLGSGSGATRRIAVGNAADTLVLASNPSDNYGIGVSVALNGDMRLTQDAPLGWSTSSTNPLASTDIALLRNAAGVLEVNNGTAGTYRDLKLRSLTTTSPSLTAGSGTGVTINASGDLRTVWYKVTVTSANCVAAATTCDLTVATLPAKTFVRRVFADLTTQYACTGVCTSSTLSGTLGTSAGGTELLASMDLDAATAQFGDADAELGSSLNAAARTANGALIDGVLASWSATTTVTYRITSGTGNLGDGAASNLSQGTIVFYLVTDVAP